MFWSLFIFDRTSIVPVDKHIPIVLNLWQHVFLTITLYLDLIFICPHYVYNLKNTLNSLLDEESYEKMKLIKRKKLIKDYILLFGLVMLYLFILIFYRYVFDFYPYPFTMQYNYTFWIFLVASTIFCFVAYLWYNFLSRKLMEFNSSRIDDENMKETLIIYLSNVNQERVINITSATTV